jgi:RNA polymerase sigma factor (sigma-70 family)
MPPSQQRRLSGTRRVLLVVSIDASASSIRRYAGRIVTYVDNPDPGFCLYAGEMDARQRDDTAQADDAADVALVVAAQLGDKEAFARVFERQRPWLVALCRRLLGDAGLAEDATQETAIQALLSLQHLRQPERFGPWLWSIGLHLCQRWRQHQAHEMMVADVGDAGRYVWEPVEPAAGPELLAEIAESGDHIRHAIEELPEGQRAAVVLFYVAGFSQADAARQLGIEVGAVKARLHKARGSLKRRLGPQAEGGTNDGR